MDAQSYCSMDLGELWPALYLPEIPGADLDMVKRVGMQAETVWGSGNHCLKHSKSV